MQGTTLREPGGAKMRKLFAGSIVALVAAVAFSPVAMAQVEQGGQTLYQRLENNGPGGPAPRRDLSGVWTGPTGAKLGQVPPMTPLGQARFKLNIPDAFSARSNDPYRTCDPLGFPRSAANETRGIAFAQMPDRVVIMTQFQKIWRVVWLDARSQAHGETGLENETFPATCPWSFEQALTPDWLPE